MSNTPVPVSIAGDVTWGPCVHTIPLPDGMEMDVAMDWFGGAKTSLHAFARTNGGVFHKGQWLVQEGHDCGPLIPHLPHMNPLNVLKSSRKAIFSASTVKVSGKPAAACHGWFVMMVCGYPFSLPMGKNNTNASHSVFVGLTDLDILKGQLEIGKQLAKDFISLAKTVVLGPSDTLKDILDDADPYAMPDASDVAIDAVFDLHNSIAVSWQSGWKEPIAIKIGASNQYRSINGEIAFSPTDPWPPTGKVEGRWFEAKGGAEADSKGTRAFLEIGRASCRERV